MFVFIFKSTLCLALLYLFYALVLQKATIHQFNRFYLLGIVFFSIFIPNYNLYIETSMSTGISSLSEVGTISNFFFDNLKVFIGIYFLVSVFLLFKFLSSVFIIAKKIIKNEKFIDEKTKIVLLNDKVLPHTFLNYLFINKEDYLQSKINDELFTHELTHINQKHSLDIILIELIHVFFWFNPLLIFVKKAIRLNHEFIADEKVVSVHSDATNYQHLLLNLISDHKLNTLVSTINYSVTKKRFLMMSKTNSRLSKYFFKISLIPVIVLFVFLFSNKIQSTEIKKNEHKIEFNEGAHNNETSDSNFKEISHNDENREHN